jgi:hypothetical protein
MRAWAILRRYRLFRLPRHFLYAVGFVSQYIVPKTINAGAVSPLPKALLVDLLLMSIFAVQHGGKARQGSKLRK